MSTCTINVLYDIIIAIVCMGVIFSLEFKRSLLLLLQLENNLICGSVFCGSGTCLTAFIALASNCGYTAQGENISSYNPLAILVMTLCYSLCMRL